MRRGQYRDSVTLMQLSRELAEVDGVEAAFVAMATELNLDLLVGMGFEPPDAAHAERHGRGGPRRRRRARGRERAARPSCSPPGHRSGRRVMRPTSRRRTVRSAARRAGRCVDRAALGARSPTCSPEAMDALDAGLSVMIFSDNVPVEHEVRLKDVGRRARAARDGAGLRHRGGPRRRARVRQRRPAGAGRHRGRVRDRRAAPHVPARRRRHRRRALPRRRRPRPVVGGRRAVDAAGAGPARRRSGDRGDRRRLEAARSERWRRRSPSTRRRSASRSCSRSSVPGGPTSPRPPPRWSAPPAATWTDPRWWPAPVERTGRYPYVRGLFSGGTLCDEAMVIAAQRSGRSLEHPARAGLGARRRPGQTAATP